MKQFMLITIWTVFWIALESTLLKDFPAEVINFDIVFISVAAIGFNYDIKVGIWPVLLMAIISNGASVSPFGIIISVYLIAYFGIRFATATIYIHSSMARFFWTFVASCIGIWLQAGLTALYFKNPAFITLAFLRFLPQSAFNGFISILIIPLFELYMGLSWEKLTRPKGLVLK